MSLDCGQQRVMRPSWRRLGSLASRRVLTNRMREYFTCESVGGAGGNPGSYPAANPAIALRLQSTRPAGRVAELRSLGGMNASDDQIDDGEFGVLNWDDQCDSWTGRTILPDGSEIHLIVSSASWSKGGRRGDRSILPGCRAAFRMLPGVIEDLKQKAVADLLSVYNDTWNQTGVPISADEFLGRIKLEGVSLSPDGGLEAYFETLDLFTDHSIRIPVDPDGSMPHGAGIEG